MNTDDFKKIAASLPKQPGIYKFKDTSGTILYVGKAKNLKNRLSSYFGNKKHQAYKTKVLVKNSDHIEFTIVETEQDALLLENTLIKKYQPRYNVMLKDGKSYTYLCIKKERFPRVFFTRNVIRDGSTYFGPYTSKFRAKIIFELLKKLFPLRTCTYNLSEENIKNEKFKVCLEYHIKNCMGPCQGYESEEEYLIKIEQIKNILRGNFKPVKEYIKEQMDSFSVNMEFEKAQHFKEKLSVFEDYQAKSTVVSTSIRDMDVFSIAMDPKNAYVNYLKVINGAIIYTNTFELTQNLNDNKKQLLSIAILNMREKYNSISQELVLPFRISGLGDEIKITVPKRGDKKKLLELSEKNVKYFLLQKQKEEMNKLNKKSPAERILKTLQNDLQMDVVPFHLECFDNSNIQGSNPTASCVVFKNAKPSKKDYRHFTIKTVEGPDDFASMEEIIYRRYSRLLKDKLELPQLIIIDGGKGQLSSAVKSLEKLELMDKITVIGIAKKLEEIFFAKDPIPIYINKKSESLKLIQQARNEAHRFALRLHRNRRSNNFISTELSNIKGIGEKTVEKLLKKFGSVKKVKASTEEELQATVGKSSAAKILAYFKDK
jgi:excinuclease ABC subunit C